MCVCVYERNNALEGAYGSRQVILPCNYPGAPVSFTPVRNNTLCIVVTIIITIDIIVIIIIIIIAAVVVVVTR